MSRLIAVILSRAGGYLVLLALILVLLFAAEPIKDAWQGRQEAQEEIKSLEKKLDELESQQTDIEGTIALAEAEWHVQQENDASPIRAELAEIEAILETAAAEWLELQRQYFDLGRTAKDLRDNADLAQAALDQIEKESWPTDIVINRERYEQLLAARAEFAARDEVANLAEAARDAKWLQIEESPYAEIALKKKQLLVEIDRIFSSTAPALPALLKDFAGRQQSIAETNLALDEAHELFNSTQLQLILSAVSAKLPLALSILVGVVLAPVAIKSIFYFFLAPLATQLPPIRIIPTDSKPALPTFAGSERSLAVQVDLGEELLIHPDFLGVAKLASHKRTQWLLNSRLPLSSVAAGMYALLRISSDDPVGTRVALACISDPLAEIGIVELPTGAAMVIQPRSLAGVITAKGMPVKITRHWRFNSAHAWLTLQLRYLVFHGPCRLILKGCNGIRMEMPDASQPSLISQAKTIGFSANLDYKTVRTAVFFPYLQGKADLFNDMFIGEEGSFVYEVLPNAGRRAGVTGRGLEGVADAVLKVFGI
jgi:hypothetical protein